MYAGHGLEEDGCGAYEHEMSSEKVQEVRLRGLVRSMTQHSRRAVGQCDDLR